MGAEHLSCNFRHEKYLDTGAESPTLENRKGTTMNREEYMKLECALRALARSLPHVYRLTLILLPEIRKQLSLETPVAGLPLNRLLDNLSRAADHVANTLPAPED